MAMQLLFPTRIYQARLAQRGWRALNARLLRECRQLRSDDTVGRRWSARNYPGGYTSYSSAHRMHRPVADVRHARAAARPPRAALCAGAAIRPARTAAGDDRLLGQHHGAQVLRTACICIRLPPSAARTTCRFRPVRRDSSSRTRASSASWQPRRARLRRGARIAPGRAARTSRRARTVRKLAAPRRGGQYARRRAHQHQFQLQLVLKSARSTRACPLRCTVSDTDLRELAEFSRGSVLARPTWWRRSPKPCAT